jgi:hypothetical protein
MNVSQWINSVLSKNSASWHHCNLEKSRRFNLIFAIASLLPVSIVGALNIAIDPYGIFNSPRLVGINYLKPVRDNNGRLFKAVDMTRIQLVTILLGSSRTNQGLDPQHPALASPAYNLGLNGANIYEIRRYLEHAIANQENLKMVVLGIDFFMFDQSENEPDFAEYRLGNRHIALQDFLNASLSLNAIASSQETLAVNQRNPQASNYARDGFMPHRHPGGKATLSRFQKALEIYFQRHPNYVLSQQALAEFKNIVELCQQKGITLKIFISPAHATDIETIDLMNQWDVYKQWKREIVKIIPVWDFSDINSITTEPISSQMKNYVDYSHYRTQIGNLVLNRLFNYQENKLPADFGVYLTPDNVENQVNRIRQELALWQRKYPKERALVQKAKMQAEKSLEKMNSKK